MHRSAPPMVLLGALLPLSGVLTACGGDDRDSAAEPAATVTVTETVTASPEPEASDGAESPTEETDTDPSTEEFGESISFENGLTISISRPKRFTPSAEATYDGYPLPKRGVPVIFTVTMTNDGDGPLARDLEFIDVTSGGRSLQTVGLDDPEFNLEALPPDTRIPAGQKSVFEMGFFVVDPKDVTVTYRGNDLDPVSFVSSE